LWDGHEEEGGTNKRIKNYEEDRRPAIQIWETHLATLTATAIQRSTSQTIFCAQERYSKDDKYLNKCGDGCGINFLTDLEEGGSRAP
jgi:hypothetical protein